MKRDPGGMERRRNLLSIYLELGKIRLSALVVLTALVGFVMPLRGTIPFALLTWTLAGTTLSACGVNMLNQWMERRRDRWMVRTRNRPLPAGEITPRHALIAGAIASVAGPLLLAWRTNPTAALLALLTGVLYLAVYTPLKTRNSLCTLAGAVVGALPPMIGWAAATGTIGFGALLLASLLFVWQIPHFLSLAWLFRDDYARGGFRMLTVAEPSGKSTFRMIILYSLALLPVALAATAGGLAGWIYGAGSFLLGAAMVLLGVRFHHLRCDRSARRLFFASLVYLPVLLTLMVIDKGPVARRTPIAVAAAKIERAERRVVSPSPWAEALGPGR